MAAITAAALVAGSTVYAANKSSKAAKDARKAQERAQVDPNEVARLARQQGIQSLRDSFAAEMEFTPENAAFRRASLGNLSGLLEGDDGSQMTALDEQIAAGGTADRSGLLSDAITRASDELALGGQLDPETRNLVTRSALARGATVGGGRLDLARFIVPRDLGTTSMALRNQRLSTAGQFGQIDQNRNQADFENLLRLRQTREQFGTNRFNRGYQLAAFGQNLTPPEVSLSAGDYASLYTNNANNAARAGVNNARISAQTAQNWGQAASSLGGLAGAVGDRWFSNPAPAPAATPTR